MGVYDIYGKEDGQLKIGPCILKQYNVGDEVEIEDGIYLTYINVIVVKDGKFIAEFECLIDKWGGIVTPREIIEENNPIAQTIKQW